MNKIKKHYFYTFLSRYTSRTYGGENYNLAVWENKGKGKFVKLGERVGCTRGYKGFDSEAWTVIWNSKSLGKLKKAILGHPDSERMNFKSYYTWNLGENFGIKLDSF